MATGGRSEGRIVLASYNIHRCYGRDGEHRPDRIREVLRQIGADVVALQEVETFDDEPGLLDYFCEDSRWQHVHGATLARDDGEYGNAILTSLPITSIRRIDISQDRREPRGALHLRLQRGNLSLGLLATHLGLRPGERRAQVERLLSVLLEPGSEDDDLTVLMGDLNEWFLWGRLMRRLHRHFNSPPAPATFPARFPLLALDRVWVDPFESLVKVRAFTSPLARLASDHLPLVAELDSGRLEQAAKDDRHGQDQDDDPGQDADTLG